MDSKLLGILYIGRARIVEMSAPLLVLEVSLLLQEGSQADLLRAC